MSTNNDKELKSSSTKNFFMKVLDKYGQSASILFQYAGINTFEDEMLSRLLTKYSKVFELEFITAQVLITFLTMKKGHFKYKEESNKKYETIVKEHQELHNNNDKMNNQLLKWKTENE